MKIYIKFFILLLIIFFQFNNPIALPIHSSLTDSLEENNPNHSPFIISFSGYIVGGYFIMDNVWYKDQKKVLFHFYNDSRGYLQVDKFGHAFGAYVQSYIAYNWLRKSGSSKTKALLYGGSLGFVLQTPIEIMDGIHEGWGFSWSDIAANAFGSAFVIGQELLFNEQLIKFKYSYWESPYSRISNGYYGKTYLQRMLKDYNGHTYWFSFPLNEVVPSGAIPPWLNLALGYGADGMIGEFNNISHYNNVNIPPFNRTRQFLLSLDIDWTKIKTGSGILNALLQTVTFVKLPFPALEFNSSGKIIGYWLYF